MAQYECECGGDVEIETRHLGPFAARGLLPPVSVLCSRCIDRLDYEVRTDGGLEYLLDSRGREYRLIGGAFVRSEAPESRELYFRDQQQRQ